MADLSADGKELAEQIKESAREFVKFTNDPRVAPEIAEKVRRDVEWLTELMIASATRKNA